MKTTAQGQGIRTWNYAGTRVMCARDLCDAPVSFWALSKQDLYRELRKLVNEDQVWKETIQQID